MDTSNNRVEKFDSNDNYLSQWGSTGTGDGQFDGPSGIALDSSNNVYAAEVENNRIQKFDSNGNFIPKWGTFGCCPAADGDLNHPQPAVESADNVYVADADGNRIQKFSNAGAFITKSGHSRI